MRYLVSHFTQTLVSALSSMGRWWVDPVKSSPTKYNLLSYSIIHLLHSDQFVLINPHKGAVSETKAPGKQWTTPPHPSLRLHPHRYPSSAPLPSTLWPLVAWKVPVYEQETERDEKRRHTWKKKGGGGWEGKIPVSAWRMKYLLKKHNATSSFVFRSLHQSTVK